MQYRHCNGTGLRLRSMLRACTAQISQVLRIIRHAARCCSSRCARERRKLACDLLRCLQLPLLRSSLRVPEIPVDHDVGARAPAGGWPAVRKAPRDYARWLAMGILNMIAPPSVHQAGCYISTLAVRAQAWGRWHSGSRLQVLHVAVAIDSCLSESRLTLPAGRSRRSLPLRWLTACQKTPQACAAPVDPRSATATESGAPLRTAAAIEYSQQWLE